MVEYNCGYACGFTEPYGFVPEAGCPIHDTTEFTAIVNAAIAREQERYAQIAFDIGYPLADEAEGKFHDGWTASDLVVDASEKIAAANSRPRRQFDGAGDKEKAMTGITAKKGTVKHMAAMGTLTFDGITCRDGLDKFTDLGLPKLWEAYQKRLIELDYWHGKYIASCPHDGQTFETWLLANEQT